MRRLISKKQKLALSALESIGFKWCQNEFRLTGDKIPMCKIVYEWAYVDKNGIVTKEQK